MSRKLEIGSGNRPQPGYEHLDIDPNCPDVDYVSSMDVVPTEDNVFDEIISIHSIEHISWRKGQATLNEWYRVMAPGGRLYIACPNMHWICKAYLENSKNGWWKDFEILHPEEKKHLMVNGAHTHTLWANFKLFSSTAGGDIHLAGYDAHLLGEMLKVAGFRKVTLLDDGPALVMEAFK